MILPRTFRSGRIRTPNRVLYPEGPASGRCENRTHPGCNTLTSLAARLLANRLSSNAWSHLLYHAWRPYPGLWRFSAVPVVERMATEPYSHLERCSVAYASARLDSNQRVTPYQGVAFTRLGYGRLYYVSDDGFEPPDLSITGLQPAPALQLRRSPITIGALPLSYPIPALTVHGLGFEPRSPISYPRQDSNLQPPDP